MATEKTVQIASAEDFFETARRTSFEDVQLPSSLTVKLVRPSDWGALMICQLNGEKLNKVLKPAADVSPFEALKEYLEWLCSLLTWAFVSPRFAKDPRLGEIGLPNLSKEDRRFIVNWLSTMKGDGGTGDATHEVSAVN